MMPKNGRICLLGSFILKPFLFNSMIQMNRQYGVLFRRTRERLYYRGADGVVAIVPNDKEVTEHSFVASRAIEHSQRRPRMPNRRERKAPRAQKTPLKGAHRKMTVNISAQRRRSRAIINTIAAKSTRVYAPFDLEASRVVPKPISIESGIF